MSPRRNWDSPTPSLAGECAPPPGAKGEGHTRLRVRGLTRDCDVIISELLGTRRSESVETDRTFVSESLHTKNPRKSVVKGAQA